MTDEKFNLGKFFGSFFQLLPWVKDARTIIAIIIVAFVGLTVWKAFFVKNQTQSQKMIIYPFSFSTVTFAPQQSQKQEVKSRAWWLPHPFVEVYGFKETDRNGLGAHGGLRWEW